MSRFILFLLVFTNLCIISCNNKKPKKLNEIPDHSNDSKIILNEENVITNIDSICTCLKDYNRYEIMKEELKFFKDNVDIIMKISDIELKIRLCETEYTKKYNQYGNKFIELLRKNCPELIEFMQRK